MMYLRPSFERGVYNFLKLTTVEYNLCRYPRVFDPLQTSLARDIFDPDINLIALLVYFLGVFIIQSDIQCVCVEFQIIEQIDHPQNLRIEDNR